MTFYEVNFDGIIGPTHHYGGLAAGNLASQQNRMSVSQPRQAALEGLEKMKLLADRGLRQAVLPPHPRPHWGFLQEQGFTGSESEIIQSAARERLDLLSIAYSAAAMWTANAATVSPSVDTLDGRVHFTPANLISTMHRQLESEETTRLFRKIFQHHRYFVVHDPLPHDQLLADEGAANQMRLCTSHAAAGWEIFVYGSDPDHPLKESPQKYPARQSRLASERVAALHELPPKQRLFLQQNPAAIDAGVFHNDVIALSNENVLVYHEQAFVNHEASLAELELQFPDRFFMISVSREEMTLEEAVSSYFFNSQLVSMPGGKQDELEEKRMLLLCPSECETSSRVRAVIDRIVRAENPVCEVRFVNIRQSMRNGGGPACLRLRVVLSEEEMANVDGNLWLTTSLYQRLREWVQQHYRETLTVEDLADPQLAIEAREAQKELVDLLEI